MQGQTPARPDSIRRHNLALVLGAVHRDGALTRAELTRRLGMSRSTVGELVADLSELVLLQESVPAGGDRAGRPSHLVTPAPNGPHVLAVDLDVTGVTVAAVALGGRVMARSSTDWPTDQPPTVTRAAETIAGLMAEVEPAVRGGRAIGVGVSVPGPVDLTSGEIHLAPNLDWHAVPFAEVLHDRLDPVAPVCLGNDADLAVLAEHRRGAGRGVAELVLLIGRVGLGAGIMVDGRLLRGRSGRVGEIGHIVVDADGPLCHCGRRGCLETYVGDAALLHLAGRSGPPTARNLAFVFDAARAGEAAALGAVRSVATALGSGLAVIVNTLDPHRVILGGSLAHLLELAAPELLGALERAVFGAGAPVELAVPVLGTDAALLGAAEIAFEPLLADPLAALSA